MLSNNTDRAGQSKVWKVRDAGFSCSADIAQRSPRDQWADHQG
jgi:hypothetical protein